ncbi:DUF4861 domain-containing protein [Dysgonomonas sp. 521]|uniref:DUF4861 family protein n=1 Tax=Dysgonomonas sp. 521 TaxID=2302932 RepID=UPI0013D1AFA8|nr:DUF4861 family protein [Dysgonomonas sp. 521]NDV95904.1 DUF4861 domain-containing protein [Dysgonomonas sp. 521]
MKNIALLHRALLFFCSILLIQVNLPAQTISVKNNSDRQIQDYTLEIPVNNLNLSFGSHSAIINNKQVPIEIVTDIKGVQKAIIPIDKIEADINLSFTIDKGDAANYPKRTYAELSHKINRPLYNSKQDSLFSWAKPNYLVLPGDFRDHSYYIKYEGPGWENDKVAFRFYLDNRNAIDVFGKKTSDIILPAVGIDDYEKYHHMSDWGMDNLKVGKALGIGSIAIWDGEKAVRVEKKDSMVCYIPADGKIRSQVKTIYYGWDANGTKCNLTSLISIDAGSRASHMELLTDKNIENIATGIIKNKKAELIVSYDKNSKWSYIATFGQQSLNNDMQGLVVFAPTPQIKEITEDGLNHIMIFNSSDGYIEYYFMPTWELDKEPVKTKDDLIRCINEVLDKLNNPLVISKSDN